MAGDYSSHFWRSDRGHIAVEWLTTWGEVRRDGKIRSDETSSNGSSRVLRPGNLTTAQCMAADVEVTLGEAPILYLVLHHRYLLDHPLVTLQPPVGYAQVIEAAGFKAPLTFWRIIHEAFGRRLVNERGLMSKPTQKLALTRTDERKKQAVGV